MKIWIVSILPDVISPPSRKRVIRLTLPFEYLNIIVVVVQDLLLIPFYLHYIGAHTYGLWLAAGGMLVWLGLVNLGIAPMMHQRIASAYGERNFSRITSFFINGLVMHIGISICVFLIGVVMAYAIPFILNTHGDEARLIKFCFMAAVVAAALNIVNECLRGFAIAMLRPVYPVLSSIICRLLGIALTVLMLFHAMGLWAIPLGMLMASVSVFLSNILFASVLLYQLGERISIQRKVIKEYLRTSPALIAGQLGCVLAKDVEPLLITLFLTPEIATAYVVLMRAGVMVRAAAHVIIGILMQSFSHLVSEHKQDEISKIAKMIMWALFWVGLIGFSSYILLNRQFVSLWVGDQNLINNRGLIPLIGISLFIFIFRNAFSGFLIASGDISTPSWLLGAEAIARLSLMVLLLSVFGLIGVPFAVLVSCGIFSFILGRRFFSSVGICVNINTVMYVGFSCVLFLGGAWFVGFFLPEIYSWLVFAVYSGIGVSVFILLLIVMYRYEVVSAWSAFVSR